MNVLQNKHYRTLLSAQLINTFGDALTAVALPLYVFKNTGSATDLSLLVLIELVTTLICGPLLAPLVDRIERKRLLSLTFLGQGLGILSIVTFDINSHLWIAYAVACFNTALFAVSRPTLLALIHDIVEGDGQILQANSYFDALDHLVQALGASTAGILIGLFNPKYAFLIDGFTFFCIAGLVLSIKVRAKAAASTATHYFADLRDGFAHIVNNRPLFLLILVSLFMGIANGAYSAIFFAHLKNTIGVSDAVAGFLTAVQGLAYALGFYLPSLKYDSKKLNIYFMCSVSVGALLFSIIIKDYFIVIPTALTCMGISYATVVSRTLTQQLSPESMRGRILALRRTVLYGGAVAATSAITASIGHTPTDVLFLFVIPAPIIAMWFYFEALKSVQPTP
ncbi:MAG: hypothetical protein A2X97_02245 [Bdellovibrionales bacterium GWA1_52_35]|nr:MAG: hypothetical protein A2X97_02245 [Bdellovibrionales bacterium GWA1_52_35]